MTSTTTPRGRRAAVLVGVATVALGTYAAGPANGAAISMTTTTMSATTTTSAPAQTALHRTTLTLDMPTCDRCVVQLFQGTGGGTDHPSAWISREKRVEGGKVTWRIPSRRTAGMSITIRAPWEGELGYVTTVAMRYGGKSVGEHVTFAEARTKRRAAACWEGTRSRAVTLPVFVRKVRVQGVKHRVPGTIAYLPTTTSWLTPMFTAPRGVLGLQEVATCL